VAGAVPGGTLADGLAHAFNSDQTPPFEQLVSTLFDNSTADQKAGFVNHLLTVLGPAGFDQALRAAGMGGDQRAEQLSPAAVQVLTQQAARKDPSIIDKAAGFYAQHPALVKSIGVGALALIMSKISKSRR
jgi:hypothetical protein